MMITSRPRTLFVMAVSRRLLLALPAVVLVGMVAGSSRGAYSRAGIGWLLTAAALALAVCLLPERSWRFPPIRAQRSPAASLLTAAALLLSGYAVFEVGLYYPEPDVQLGQALIYGAALAGFCLVVTFLFGLTEETGVRRGFWLRVLLLFVTGAVLRVSVLYVSPDPVIDVYGWLRDAPGFLLHGQNPYTAEYDSPYGTDRARQWGLFMEPESRPAAYPPLPMLLALPFRAAGRDVRWANIVCDLLAALVLFLAGRSRGQTLIGALAAAAYLHAPAAPFLIEQAWYEPMLAALLGGGLLLADRGWQAGYLLLGLGLTGKQYGLFLLPPVLRAQRRCWRSLLLGIAVAGAILFLPFLLWDRGEFLNVILFKHLERPPQTWSLTLLSAAHDLLGLGMSPAVRWVQGTLLVLLIGLITWTAPADGLQAAWWLGTTLLAFCLCHTQGFFNYYYLCEYLLLLGVVGLATREP